MSPRSARRTADALCVLAALLVVASVRLAWGRDLTGQDSADWFFLIATALGAAVYLADRAGDRVPAARATRSAGC